MTAMRAYAMHLRERRLALGIMAKTVAYSIGVSPVAVCAWERGRRNPSPDHFDKWRRFVEKYHPRLDRARGQ